VSKIPAHKKSIDYISGQLYAFGKNCFFLLCPFLLFLSPYNYPIRRPVG